jgi:methyl-accepting chemotaxis protein
VQKHLATTRTEMEKLNLATAPVDQLSAMQKELMAQYLEALKQFEPGKLESTQTTDRLVRGKDRPLEQKFAAVVADLEKFAGEERARAAAADEAASSSLKTTFFAILLAAVVLSVFLSVQVTRGVTGPISVAVQTAQRVASGDLTVHVERRVGGEVGQLLDALATMSGALRELVGEVARGAHAMADTSAQIAQGNLDLSQRTEEQAGTLEETAGSMEELTTTVTSNAEHARQASNLAVEATAVARKSGEAVGKMVGTMHGIAASSRRISDITGVIDGIAFQTNILALNAAVEAARAGEQGRGFAVVASEVRNLAQRSATAAKEIKGLVVESVQQMDAGSSVADTAGKTMEEVVAAVRKVSELMAEIAAASREQSAGIEQVNTAMAQMDQVVQQNASLVEEAAAATESMKAQAAALRDLVSRFRLGAEAAAVAVTRSPALAAGAAQPLLARTGGGWTTY